MLSNAYFLAKICFDAAENEPAKNLQNFAKFQKSETLGTGARGARESHGAEVLPDGEPGQALEPRLGPDPGVRRCDAQLAKLAIFQILANFAIFLGARSRLHQNEILQENMRLTEFFKLYKICIL